MVISALGYLWDLGYKMKFYVRVMVPKSLPGVNPKPHSGPILDPTADPTVFFLPLTVAADGGSQDVGLRKVRWNRGASRAVRYEGTEYMYIYKYIHVSNIYRNHYIKYMHVSICVCMYIYGYT